MKKIYFVFFSLIAGLSAKAQLTQANQAPMDSYTFQLYHCDSVNIAPGSAGAGTLWNFSNIVTYTNRLASYTTLSVTGNASYPQAQEAVASSANNTSYYSSTASELDYHGGNISIGAVQAALVYTTPAVVAAYPMNLNTSTTSVTGGNINVTSAGINGTFTGSCSVIADGTGTISLPGANNTFTNAMRVVTNQTLDVTASIGTATVVQTTYDYYSIGIRNPIFSISTSTAYLTAFGQTSTNTQTTVTRDKNAVPTATTTTTTVGIAENTSNSFELNVYPNPSSSYVQFVSDSQDAKQVSLYDITGKLVIRETLTDGKVKLDVSELNTGLYMYTVSGQDNRALKSGKMTVSH